jgi:hypothetical protein
MIVAKTNPIFAGREDAGIETGRQRHDATDRWIGSAQFISIPLWRAILTPHSRLASRAAEGR